MFQEKDLLQFQQKGIDISIIQTQLENFRKGFPYAQIERAATIGDGILKIQGEALKEYIAAYEKDSSNLAVYKFVPASGAASRMFKALFTFMDSYKGTSNDLELLKNDHPAIYTFFKDLKKFAFYDSLKSTLASQGNEIEVLRANGEYVKILKALLTEEGLNYGGLPKGLLEFHKYDTGARTPLEEHLVEGANYCKGTDGKVYLHFTVSPQHQAKFEELIAEVKADYEHQASSEPSEFIISLSEQAPYTDTIAVDMNNQPFRLDDGSILFRPGGHGALIENVNKLDADLVFIKNIDNVVPDNLKQTTYEYKKLIGGVLLKYQAIIFDYLNQLDTQEQSEALLIEIENFLTQQLALELPAGYAQMNKADKFQFLKNKLHRPIKVCGMVKNEGEPGGGPFWTRNSDGTVSLQIVESAQIDKENSEQLAIMKNSSHFNPVDLVCGLKDYKGQKFDLLKYRDPNTGFIAYKSSGGRELKAQELPGLWNGAMADWNTLFVEVPIITFNPVKTVNDLLREQHQV